MTTTEVALKLRVKPITVRRWLYRGEMTGIKTPAGWRISKDDFDSWLNNHRERRYRISQGLNPISE
jgi:excisionase family DNA binding protein